MSDLSRLNSIIEELQSSAALIDRTRGEHHRPLFDDTLFHCHGKLLTPCVTEAQGTLNAIVREQKAGKLTQPRAEYLTERLLSQIRAIQREMSTQAIRKNEPKHFNETRKPISDLYQDLAQHQDWERRLMILVQDKQATVESSFGANKTAAQQALLTAEQRLKRCQEAKTKIEKQITFREKNQ
ncbi:primosomal replication protein [Vibrio ziniensis]|uniref:Prepilin peptidase n=1 Tax=Vibrio ziniensis TaxID=2711221 RepID=A0A6G7CGZ9_9VIBR|nr:primosomal replication protein [Vibrio ziniensis]QIH41354.1 prepilin peptidase [Vibrio ziniensis]